MTTERRPHDPHHPYVRRFVGCGHGRLFSEACEECEIVRLQEQYLHAARTEQRVMARLKVLGVEVSNPDILAEREACALLCERSDRYRGDYFAAKIRGRSSAGVTPNAIVSGLPRKGETE